MHMTVLEAIGVGLGFLAIVAPEFWPKMPRPLSYILAGIGLAWLTYSFILGVEELTGGKLRYGPLALVVLGAALIAGGLFWHISRLGAGNSKEQASHGHSEGRDQNAIYQGGVNVGRAYGRRSPTDATAFEFFEITNAAQFNSDQPFEYQGVQLRMVRAASRTGLNSARPQDGTIYAGVLARLASEVSAKAPDNLTADLFRLKQLELVQQRLIPAVTQAKEYGQKCLAVIQEASDEEVNSRDFWTAWTQNKNRQPWSDGLDSADQIYGPVGRLSIKALEANPPESVYRRLAPGDERIEQDRYRFMYREFYYRYKHGNEVTNKMLDDIKKEIEELQRKIASQKRR